MLARHEIRPNTGDAIVHASRGARVLQMEEAAKFCGSPYDFLGPHHWRMMDAGFTTRPAP